MLADTYGATKLRSLALNILVANRKEFGRHAEWREKLSGHPEIMVDVVDIMFNKHCHDYFSFNEES